jgi:23S rRNA (adenine-N6)-dimethyltransferase
MLKQNSFKDQTLLRTTLAACSFTKSDLVYEIEPEDELITSELAVLARKVGVWLKHPVLVDNLKVQLKDLQNVEVHELDFTRTEFEDQPYKVFANVSAVLTSEVMNKILNARIPPVDSFLLMREDAANRYSGLPKENDFSILVKPWFEVNILRKFRKVDFEPVPSVDLVLLNLKIRKRPAILPEDANTYRSFVKFSFDAGKKGMDAGYQSIFTEEQWKQISKDLGVKQSSKPSEMTFEQWLHLFKNFTKIIPNSKRLYLLKKKSK